MIVCPQPPTDTRRDVRDYTSRCWELAVNGHLLGPLSRQAALRHAARLYATTDLRSVRGRWSTVRTLIDEQVKAPSDVFTFGRLVRAVEEDCDYEIQRCLNELVKS